MWSTIRHLMRYDARALKTPLLVWAAVLALQLAIVAVGPLVFGEVDRSGRVVVDWGQGGTVLRLAMTVILAALLLQRDTPVGTSAFWLTRPIAGRAMWSAKLLSLAGWCAALPAVLGGLLFVWLGVSAVAAMRVAGQMFVEQAIFVAFAVAIASLTATLAHFVLAAMGGMVVVWMLTPALRTLRGVVPAITVPYPDAILHAWIGSVLFAAVAISAHQYLTRRHARGWMVAVACLMLAQGTLVVVRNAPAQDASMRRGPSYTPPADVVVRLSEQAVDEPIFLQRDIERPTPGRALSAGVWVDGPQDAIVYEPVGVVRSEAVTAAEPVTVVRWTDDKRRGPWWTARVAVNGDQPYRSLKAALGVDRLGLSRSASVPMLQVYVGMWPMEAYRAFAAKGGGTLRAEVAVRAYRYRVAGTLPLRAGASYAADDHRFAIVGVERTMRGLVVDAREAFAGAQPADTERTRIIRYILRNRSRREAVCFVNELVERTFLTVGFGSGPDRPGSGLRRLEFDSRLALGDGIAFTDEWVAGAELAVLEPEELGTFTQAASTRVPAAGVAR